jgi:hypothetical protein
VRSSSFFFLVRDSFYEEKVIFFVVRCFFFCEVILRHFGFCYGFFL